MKDFPLVELKASSRIIQTDKPVTVACNFFQAYNSSKLVFKVNNQQQEKRKGKHNRDWVLMSYNEQVSRDNVLYFVLYQTPTSVLYQKRKKYLKHHLLNLICEFEVFGLHRRLCHLYLVSFNNTININVNSKNLTCYHIFKQLRQM